MSAINGPNPSFVNFQFVKNLPPEELINHFKALSKSQQVDYLNDLMIQASKGENPDLTNLAKLYTLLSASQKGELSQKFLKAGGSEKFLTILEGSIKLRSITTLPDDILINITGALEPKEQVALSKATRALNKVYKEALKPMKEEYSGQVREFLDKIKKNLQEPDIVKSIEKLEKEILEKIAGATNAAQLAFEEMLPFRRQLIDILEKLNVETLNSLIKADVVDQSGYFKNIYVLILAIQIKKNHDKADDFYAENYPEKLAEFHRNYAELEKNLVFVASDFKAIPRPLLPIVFADSLILMDEYDIAFELLQGRQLALLQIATPNLIKDFVDKLMSQKQMDKVFLKLIHKIESITLKQLIADGLFAWLVDHGKEGEALKLLSQFNTSYPTNNLLGIIFERYRSNNQLEALKKMMAALSKEDQEKLNKFFSNLPRSH